MFKYLCLAVFFTKSYYCANILVLNAVPSYSHQVAYMPLWKALSLRGHNVTLLTANPLRDPKLVNLTEIDVNWGYKYSRGISIAAEHKISPWNYHQTVYGILYEVCDRVLSHEILQILLSNKVKYDLVFAEYLCPELLAVAKKYNCPKILVASMRVPAVFSNSLGDWTHPVLNPEFLLPFYGQLNFKERIISTLFSWYLDYVLKYNVFAKRQKLLREYLNDMSTIPELLSDVDMLFLSTNPHIHGPTAASPNIVAVGGFREDLSAVPIPLDTKTFLDSATEGCIFLSLGNNVKSSELSESILKPIKDALTEIPYKVLWKFEADIDGLPEHIKTAKWFPQQKILNHPNLKLFVTQGGLQSIEESIYGEVPFVVVPFFADQYQNAKILENKEVAVVLDRTNLSKEKLKEAIVKVMNDPMYRNRVRELKELILDEPMNGLQKAVWWTEYVLRNKGAKHLRNPSADLPSYQFFLVDVIGFLLAVIILFIVFTVLIIRVVLQRAYKMMKRVDIKKEKTQ